MWAWQCVSYCMSPYSSLVNKSTKPTSPPTYRTYFNFTEESKTSKGLLRPEKGGKLRRNQRLATRHARADETRRRMVVGTGRLCPTQTGENSFQETTRRRGRSTSAVTGRSRRLVEFQKITTTAGLFSPR